jgi:hypothetical protein
MDWAYRMVSLHNLDPLGGLIVMHLGWRDHADLRTDRGIARTLNQHRASVQKATAKLAALGVITRRSGQWVACETVAIIEQAATAQRPTQLAADDVAGDLGARPTELAGGGLLSGPQVAYSVGHKRKENIEKGQRPLNSRSRSPQAGPVRPVGGSVAGLSSFQRSRILSGQSLVVDGVPVKPGSPHMDALRQALRSQDAGELGGVA